MKAYLLAAGLGTRLRPITDTIPKCMVPICGKPLLQWWMELFDKHGITDVLINTHYLSDSVRAFIDENNKSFPVKLYESYEVELVGSGGTVRNNIDFVDHEDDFLIVYADNLTNTNLSDFISSHNSHKDAVLTMALFHTNRPKECGIVALDESNRITEFEEKPVEPKSDLANAGIYVCSKDVFNYIPDKGFCDFGKDILPELVGNMYGWQVDDYLLDIGTMDNYKIAQKDWVVITESARR